MTWTALFIIVLVLGVIVSNVMLLKHSAKMSMKNFNRDPLDDAKKRLEERESNDNPEEPSKHSDKKDES